MYIVRYSKCNMDYFNFCPDDFVDSYYVQNCQKLLFRSLVEASLEFV